MANDPELAARQKAGTEVERRMVLTAMPAETRLVVCPECDGYAARVIGHGRFADGSENNEEVPCPCCDGTGRAEQAVEPVECDDDLEERS